MIEKLNKLKELKFSGAHELSLYLEKNNAFRKDIEGLSKRFLGKTVSGCKNCYFDAFMELKYYKVMEESKFKIRAGALLYDPVNKDVKKVLTSANITDELALYHLKHNPNCRKYFYVVPDNLEELLASYGESTEDEVQEEEVPVEEVRGVLVKPKRRVRKAHVDELSKRMAEGDVPETETPEDES